MGWSYEGGSRWQNTSTGEVVTVPEATGYGYQEYRATLPTGPKPGTGTSSAPTGLGMGSNGLQTGVSYTPPPPPPPPPATTPTPEPEAQPAVEPGLQFLIVTENGEQGGPGVTTSDVENMLARLQAGQGSPVPTTTNTPQGGGMGLLALLATGAMFLL